MSNRNKGTSLPPLDDSGSLAGRSPRQGKRTTSYDYRPDSTSPTTSPRSPNLGRVSPRLGPAKDVEKEFRAMCIGSPIPASDPHHEDLMTTPPPPVKLIQDKPKPFRKTPSITIDRVDELNLTKDSKRSPRGGGGGGGGGSGSGAPLSPVSYDLIEHMPTTPFAMPKGGSDRMLLISPNTPPVERKGNRQVINYCRSDGHLASSSCSTVEGDDPEHGDPRRHNRSRTDGSQSETDNKSRELTASMQHRELSPSPRLTRRARENEGGWSGSRDPSPRSPRRRQQQPQQREEHPSSPRGERNTRRSPSPRHEARRRNTKEPENTYSSQRPEAKKPVRLQPLSKK